MKKTYTLIDLDCANCARKMEEGIKKLEGVKNASVSYMTEKLVLEADDHVFDAVLKQAQAVIKKIEPDCKIKL